MVRNNRSNKQRQKTQREIENESHELLKQRELNSLKKAIESAKQEVEGCRKEEEAFKQLVK